MKSINFLAIFVLVLSALLILPAFSSPLNLTSWKTASYDGCTEKGAYSGIVGNRTCQGVGGGCDANLTFNFDLTDISGVFSSFNITKYFSTPAGSSGWSSSPSVVTNNLVMRIIAGRPDVVTCGISFLTKGQVLNAGVYCSAINSTGGEYFAPNAYLGNGSQFNFVCTTPIDIGAGSAYDLAVSFVPVNGSAWAWNSGKGTSFYPHDWATISLPTESIIPWGYVYPTRDVVCTSNSSCEFVNNETLNIEYCFYGCSNSTDWYNCNAAVSFLNGTVIRATTVRNLTCSLGSPMCYDEDSLDVSDLELGTYRFTAECDYQGNASMPLLTGNYTFDIKPLSWATTTIAPSGLTANAIALGTSSASVYWGNWLLANVYLVAGLFFAVVVLVIFLVLSAEFNMPILATAGVIIAAFIALVTLILTSPAGLLILIVLVLLLLVIGAFAIFKGMSA